MTGPGPAPASEGGHAIHETFKGERGRLWRYIRSRVRDRVDAEDILQDVFTELVVAHRLLKPVNHLRGWLFQVARNRITDRHRARSRWDSTSDSLDAMEPGALEAMLPSAAGGPDAAYARAVLQEALEDALAELPGPQRDVFVAHELEGRSFKEMSEETGVGVNTLLSRKRYAVLHLRRRLQSIYDDFVGEES